MKSWAFAAIFISIGALAACDDGGTGGSGGSGGSGGTGGTGGTGGGTTTTTTTTTGGMGGGTTGCDSGDPSGASCGDTSTGCIACALGGNCADELATCQAEQDCVDFATCIDPCADQACFDQCVADHPTGADTYNNILFCVICEECPVDCDGPGSGCP